MRTMPHLFAGQEIDAEKVCDLVVLFLLIGNSSPHFARYSSNRSKLQHPLWHQHIKSHHRGPQPAWSTCCKPLKQAIGYHGYKNQHSSDNTTQCQRTSLRALSQLCGCYLRFRRDDLPHDSAFGLIYGHNQSQMSTVQQCHWIPTLVLHAVSASKVSARNLRAFGSLEAHPCGGPFAMPHRSPMRNGQSECRRRIWQRPIVELQKSHAVGPILAIGTSDLVFGKHRVIPSLPREASGIVVSPNAQWILTR